MNRFGAFVAHVAISLIVFAALAGLVLYVWYPDFFFDADGGWQGLRIIVLVDLVAGPLLTLIVYKPGKPSLRMDLTLIAIFQVICLAGGTWVVWNERPLALVYSDGTFFSMSGEDFEEVGASPDLLDSLPGPWPKRVAVVLPDDFTLQSQLRLKSFQSNRPVRTLFEYYQPFTPAVLDIEHEAIAPQELESLDKASQHLTPWVARHGGSLSDYAFFHFATRYGYGFLGVRKTDRTLVGLLKTQGLL